MTSTAPTTTAPYGGQFTPEEVEVFEAFLDAEEAFHESEQHPESPDIAAIEATHDPRAAELVLESLATSAGNGIRVEFPSGTRPVLTPYSTTKVTDDRIDMTVCYVNDAIVVDVASGDIVSDQPAWDVWQVIMIRAEDRWQLLQATIARTGEGASCP